MRQLLRGSQLQMPRPTLMQHALTKRSLPPLAMLPDTKAALLPTFGRNSPTWLFSQINSTCERHRTSHPDAQISRGLEQERGKQAYRHFPDGCHVEGLGTKIVRLPASQHTWRRYWLNAHRQ